MEQDAQIFSGKTLTLVRVAGDFAELRFDRQGAAVNILDQLALGELRDALELLMKTEWLRGLLLSSEKDAFIVGADITEFVGMFKLPDRELEAIFHRANQTMNCLEDLPVPTVAAINGFALGGGFELALAADFRVAAQSARLGFPEVNLGIFPGFGGTVRMPRLAGPATAAEWIGGGKPATAQNGMSAGVVDRVVPDADLREQAFLVLRHAATDQGGWLGRRSIKRNPVRQVLDREKLESAVTSARALAAKAHQSAPAAAIQLMANNLALERAGALALETSEFLKIARTQAADSLVQIFLSEQVIKRKSKDIAKRSRPLRGAAVLGAGIMGGGISFASAVRGVPVILKDIDQMALETGIAESKKLLAKHISGGRITAEKSAAVLASIRPQLDYKGIEAVDFIIEAVVEKLSIKHAVLRELEGLTRNDAIIASNTSSLRIDDLATVLTHPAKFVGMHFFNPASVMPLVEVVRGRTTSETTLATAVDYALKMGKVPIVVNDGPGFLVNRVLTAYMLVFNELVCEGIDFVFIDQAMQAFGWPMGPAYLNDVIGMDTAAHVFEAISAGFPTRLRRAEGADAVRLMADCGRLGQKNGIGFYKYEPDLAGKPKKSFSSATRQLLATLQKGGERILPPQQIVERMMLALISEAAWCLQDGIVASPEEVDMALILGLGLPRYLGGALKYADWLGLPKIEKLSDENAPIGAHYVVPPQLRAKAGLGERYYSNTK